MSAHLALRVAGFVALAGVGTDAKETQGSIAVVKSLASQKQHTVERVRIFVAELQFSVYVLGIAGGAVELTRIRGVEVITACDGLTE